MLAVVTVDDEVSFATTLGHSFLHMRPVAFALKTISIFSSISMQNSLFVMIGMLHKAYLHHWLPHV